jgi:NAD(P)-dependent dehydrogenase (short-subunit alcohol dehydrogenase family)
MEWVKVSDASLAGRVVIVTGGGRGIGAGISRVLGSAGATVLIFHQGNGEFDEVAHAQDVIAQIESKGGKGFAYQVDLGKRDEIFATVEVASKAHGRIDGLVNNAGICRFASFFDITPENWDRHLDVNLSGPFFLSQAVARHMRDQGKGSIVNISTVSSRRGGDRQVHYISSKGGVNSMTTSMAHELRDMSIRVNAILVGGVATDINRQQFADRLAIDSKAFDESGGVRKLGKPEDLGYAARYLLSDESEWVTGSLISVDGGAMVS